MARCIEIVSPGMPSRTVPLERGGTAGGSRADAVHVAGLPPAAVRVTPCSAGIVVEALATGVRAAGVPLPPGGRRLLRPGERAELLGTGLSVPAAPDPETRVAAAALLRAASDGEAAALGPHLLVLTGSAAGARLPLGADQVVGRGRGAGVRLRDPLASRRHVRLTLAGDRAVVEDLGAKNGVLVNGARAERRRVPLEPGDELVVGETHLVLVVPGASGPPSASPAPAAPQPRAGSGRRGGAGGARLAAAALLAVSAAALALATS